MKVLDLQCGKGHVFEGWFSSEDDFQAQCEQRALVCPMCGSEHVVKRLSAPRLNLGSSGGVDSKRQPVEHKTGSEVAALPAKVMQAAWLQMVRNVMSKTENVGQRFAEEARRMHYGETAERGIRGQATADEAESLLQEGISVLPLPVPDGMDDGSLQ